MSTDPHPGPGPASGSLTARNRATISHLSAFVMFFGIPAPVGPLIAWLLWKEDPEVAEHAKEALNFNLSIVVYAIIAAVLILALVGLLLLPAILIAWLVLVIVASVKVSSGQPYRYPLTIRFIA